MSTFDSQAFNDEEDEEEVSDHSIESADADPETFLESDEEDGELLNGSEADKAIGRAETDESGGGIS